MKIVYAYYYIYNPWFFRNIAEGNYRGGEPVADLNSATLKNSYPLFTAVKLRKFLPEMVLVMRKIGKTPFVCLKSFYSDGSSNLPFSMKFFTRIFILKNRNFLAITLWEISVEKN